MFPRVLRGCLCQFPCSIYLQTPKKKKRNPRGLQQQRQGHDGFDEIDKEALSRLPSETSERHIRRSQQWTPFPGGEMEDSNE